MTSMYAFYMFGLSTHKYMFKLPHNVICVASANFFCLCGCRIVFHLSQIRNLASTFANEPKASVNTDVDMRYIDIGATIRLKNPAQQNSF